MQKFLMAAALLAVVACGEKKAPAVDTTATMTAPAATTAPMTAMDSMKRDSVIRDSMRKDSMMKHDTTKPPAKP